MSAAEKWNFVSVEEYLAEEEDSPVKREHCDGIVYDMAERRNDHNEISGNGLASLDSPFFGVRQHLVTLAKPPPPSPHNRPLRPALISGDGSFFVAFWRCHRSGYPLGVMGETCFRSLLRRGLTQSH